MHTSRSVTCHRHGLHPTPPPRVIKDSWGALRPAVLTFRQHAQGLIGRVPAHTRCLPGGGAVTGHTGALWGRERPLGG